MPIYMHFEGVEGDVTAKGYEKWIELNTLNFGVNRDIRTRTGKTSDRENTLPTVGEVVVSLNMSKSSPNLFNEACVGKAKSVKISVCQTSTGAPREYVHYDLSEVLISGYHTAIPISDLPKDTLTLNFNKMVMKYTPFSQGNTPQAPTAAGYDLVTGTKV